MIWLILPICWLLDRWLLSWLYLPSSWLWLHSVCGWLNLGCTFRLACKTVCPKLETSCISVKLMENKSVLTIFGFTCLLLRFFISNIYFYFFVYILWIKIFTNNVILLSHSLSSGKSNIWSWSSLMAFISLCGHCLFLKAIFDLFSRYIIFSSNCTSIFNLSNFAAKCSYLLELPVIRIPYTSTNTC